MPSLSAQEQWRKEWARKVGRVFNTMPRDGSSSSTVWLRRDKVENKIGDVLENVGVHICLDGPTGTGKTSLALTGLNKASIKYALVQVTQAMDWAAFCKRLIQPPDSNESAVSRELEVGVDRLLPYGKYRVSLGSKGRAADKVELLETMAQSWREHEVCQLMATENTTLLIDDFERASEDLVRRVSDMCKLLTQSYQSPYAKLVIVGTGDIYRKLYDANPSLESRIEEISLGTLPSRNDSWKFMLLGFEALKLKHPANDRNVDAEELFECIQAVYEAADGLPKSLNELGREISLKGVNRSRVSPADVKEVAREMPKRNLHVYRRAFPGIVKCVERNPAVRKVLQFLYTKGIGQIHSWSDIISELQGGYPEDQVDNAICELIGVQFLVRTGPSGDVLFTNQPTLAHLLGVLISNPVKYNAPSSLYENGQLVFSFVVKDEGQLSLPYMEGDVGES